MTKDISEMVGIGSRDHMDGSGPPRQWGGKKLRVWHLISSKSSFRPAVWVLLTPLLGGGNKFKKAKRFAHSHLRTRRRSPA